METKQFRDDAKAGGCEFADVMFEDDLFAEGDMYRLLLMPEAWQAVGKTRGWKICMWDCKVSQHGNRKWCKVGHEPIWLVKWQYFIFNLADGKTIEEALTAIK